MRELKGIRASPGVFVGTVYILREEEDLIVPNYPIEKHEVDSEWQRYMAARSKAVCELTELRDKASGEAGGEHAAIFDSHLLMLNDIELEERIEAELSRSLRNIEWIVQQVEEEFVTQLGASGDAYLAERTADIRDVSRRLLSHLLKLERRTLANLKGERVLVAKNLLPSEIMAMNRGAVKAIALDAGGTTSHTAILARAFRIPAVLGLGDVTRLVRDGMMAAVDGDRGLVILDPDEATVSRYRGLRQRREEREAGMWELRGLPAVTLDGHQVALKGNIEIPLEAEDAVAQGAEGIGLFRSEFLFLQPDAIPSEEEQYRAFAEALHTVAPESVTVRTLDLGGDKMLPELEAEDEKNPLLGWRAIRFCLGRQDLFRTHLRAILRAGVHGKLKIMFPMISGPEELERALAVLESVKDDLRKEGVPHAADAPVGIMVEIPSAAMVADILAPMSAFFSIGTNDLTQYTIAVDRGNERTAELYRPFHPAVLRLIQRTIDQAHAAGITAAMCGELAGDPYATVLLLGMGLDEFSMSPSAISRVKSVIRSTTMAEAKDFADRILSLGRADKIEAEVHAWMDAKFGLDQG